jgi:CubicO group peptidase (beta-lactamase class C family)
MSWYYRWIILVLMGSLLTGSSVLQQVYSQEEIAPWPTEEWSRSTPEAQGIDPEALVEILQFFHEEEINFHSVLLVRNGYLVLEVYRPPYDADESHALVSATKTITSILVGIAIDQGYIEGVDQPVIDLFPELTFDNMDADKAAITVEDFLTMRGGLSWSGISPQEILNNPVAHPPGTVFQYNQAQPRFFSSTIEQMTGMDTLDFAREMLFEPLGISVEDDEWGRVRRTRDGALALSLTPQEMAKIGYLYLNDGMWDGQHIVSAEWVEQSTSLHVEELPGFDAYGYGYFWWVSTGGSYYLAVGSGTQLIAVFPEKDMVLVMTADTGAINSFIEDYIAPLTVSDTPIPENLEAAAELDTLIGAFTSAAD